MIESPLIIKNNRRLKSPDFLHTTMVSHQGVPVSFAMTGEGKIFYSVLDLSNSEQEDQIDKNFWSRVNFSGPNISMLRFPSEISQIGYGVVPNSMIKSPDDPDDLYNSTTAKLGAKVNFQALSDGQYIYIFRQSIAQDDLANQRSEDSNLNSVIVDSSLLVDRFILSGTTLKLSREIRYQHSKHKTEPKSVQDNFSPTDIDGNPFYEPTRELAFAKVNNGNFTVLLIPGENSEEQRWQIFCAGRNSDQINSFNILFDSSEVFDLSESQIFIDKFIENYGLDQQLIVDVQEGIRAWGQDDHRNAEELVVKEAYLEKNLPLSDLVEVVYTIRTGVSNDSFILAAESEWPLIEYAEDGTAIKAEYLNESNFVKEEFAFTGDSDMLKPRQIQYTPKSGISSCFYYQQEVAVDGKLIKDKGSVMLAVGVENYKEFSQYIAVLNFSVASSGQLSRLTNTVIPLADINIQALDENPYARLEDIPKIDNKLAWQRPQKMKLLDMDSRGLSTGGGVLKFAFTSIDVSEGLQYSDAIVATYPYLFDDSLGRVNLYFKGKNNNFFVLYFNPTGNRSFSMTETHANWTTETIINLPLLLNPRLDRDIHIDLSASMVMENKNSCNLTMKSTGEIVESWAHVPRDYVSMAQVLNGDGAINLGALEPIPNETDPKAAYIRNELEDIVLKIRTNANIKSMFQEVGAYADILQNGNNHSVLLEDLSRYLTHNRRLGIGKRSFEIRLDHNVTIQADTFHKSYLLDIVSNPDDVDILWEYLGSDPNLVDGESLQYLHLIHKVQPEDDSGFLTHKALIKDLEGITMSWLYGLPLDFFDTINEADLKARKYRFLKELKDLFYDVADVRIVSLPVHDVNQEFVDRLSVGLKVDSLFNYESNFFSDPIELDGISAEAWEYERSYLFDAQVSYAEVDSANVEVSTNFEYQYEAKIAIGQWEDWEASLAVEFLPESSTHGSALYTLNSDKLPLLAPTSNGLSLEVWIKPSIEMYNSGSIIYYKNSSNHYALKIKKNTEEPEQYNIVASIGLDEFTSENTFPIQNSNGTEKWSHITLTTKKIPNGYNLNQHEIIDVGNDNSLELPGEFTIEVLANIDTPGSLLAKHGEYELVVNDQNQIIFKWGSRTFFDDQPIELDSLNTFYKITLIRSISKLQKEPEAIAATSPFELLIQEKIDSGQEPDRKELAQIMMKMVKKQASMDYKMSSSRIDIKKTRGVLSDQINSEKSSKYYHALIISNDQDEIIKEFYSEEANYISDLYRPRSSMLSLRMNRYQSLVFGGEDFNGTFGGIRIWKRVLTDDEVKSIESSQDETHLVSNWTFDEGEGTIIHDSKGENHGKSSGEGWTYSPMKSHNDEIRLYVDGVPEACSVTRSGFPDVPDQFVLGAYITENEDNSQHQYQDHFKGSLEEIRIWNVNRSEEQIIDNTFGRLKGEWEQLLANYTFDNAVAETNNQIQDTSLNGIHLGVRQQDLIKEVLSTAPIATEIPQIRSALTGVITDYNGTILSQPSIVEYGDIQKNEDGTVSGILKRCYSFIDGNGKWNRMTGYKVGNLVSEWQGQTQFAPQIVGYLEGTPPVPAENFSVASDGDIRTYAFKLNNSVSFTQAEEITYNYSTSKDFGWTDGMNKSSSLGGSIETIIAPFGFGISIKASGTVSLDSNWKVSNSLFQSYARGTSLNESRSLSASLAGYDNELEGEERYYKLGNTGYALVKSKIADVYLIRLAHNNALVSISLQPNAEIPEDVNIIPFPINPLYTKQGTLDGKFGEDLDPHYPQAHNAYGNYSYFKPTEAYELKGKIEKEKMALETYFEDTFDFSGLTSHFDVVDEAIRKFKEVSDPIGNIITSLKNSVLGNYEVESKYRETDIKKDLVDKSSQRNLVNSYVWTIEGGFYAESTQVTDVQQETFTGSQGLSTSDGQGFEGSIEGGGVTLKHKVDFSKSSDLTVTRSKSNNSSSSFGLDVSVDLPTSPRYKYGGVDHLTLQDGLIPPGTVDAYRFMSFYLEPKKEHYEHLYSQVIDSKWLDESSDANAMALRQAFANSSRAKPCWRIMHRVTYVSRVLPKFQPEAPPSLEKVMRVSGIESNYLLIKRFEPYLINISDSANFFAKIEEIIDQEMQEFKPYKQRIKYYLGLYYSMDQV